MVKRNSGLDIVRVMSMCGIVILHILGKGGILSSATPGTTFYWLAWLLEIIAMCSVNLFAILSGYLGYGKLKSNVPRIMELLLVVVFYSCICTLIFLVIKPAEFGNVKSIVQGVFPMLVGRYWYITCYIPVALLQPYINLLLLKLSCEQHKKLCVLCVILFSVIPSVFRVDFFSLNEGYSFIWLLVCYIIGGYLKRTAKEKINITVGFGACFLVALILVSGNIFIFWVKGMNIYYFIEYISPFILFMAIILFKTLSSISIKNEKVCKVLSKMASVAFDVYIIHCHIYIFEYILMNAYVWVLTLTSIQMIVVVILNSLVIYVMLALIGLFRIKLFECLKINNIIIFLTSKTKYLNIDLNNKNE